MNKRRMITIVIGFLFFSAMWIIHDSIAKDDGGFGGADQGKMMEAWQELITPVTEHKALDFFVGDWTTKIKIWMAGLPMESEGTVTFKWIMGGCYLCEEHTGQMMGQAFQGMGISGYDKVQKVYSGIWLDNMGTQILNYSGSCDASGKVFTYYGKMDEPMLGIYGKQVKYVTRIINDDKYEFEMFDLHAGENVKMMHATVQRKK